MTKDQAAFLIKLIHDYKYKLNCKEEKFIDSILLMDYDLSWKQEKWLNAIYKKSTEK